MGQVLTKQQGHQEHAYFHHRITSCFIQSLRFLCTSSDIKPPIKRKKERIAVSISFDQIMFINKDIEFKKRKSSYEDHLWHYNHTEKIDYQIFFRPGGAFS